MKHCVCVKLDATIQDSAANAFTRAFYISLAVGKTVQQSFDIGKQAVAASPFSKSSSSEFDKFLLLPEDPENKLHNFPVFTAKEVSVWPVGRPPIKLGMDFFFLILNYANPSHFKS